MLASFPASMVNQNRSDLGILNRFNLTPSRSRAADRREHIEQNAVDGLEHPAGELVADRTGHHP
jgi:hypothetical protein